MNTKFDWKVLLFRAFTGAYTGFLAGFCPIYVKTSNWNSSLQAGLAGLVAGIATAFGIDQTIYNYVKTTAANNPCTPATDNKKS